MGVLGSIRPPETVMLNVGESGGFGDWVQETRGCGVTPFAGWGGEAMVDLSFAIMVKEMFLHERGETKENGGKGIKHERQ